MAQLEILTFPDPRLREMATEVSAVTPELSQLADDMLETMYAAKGIGLAAPQVGQLVRLLVMDVRPQDEKGRYEVNEMTELEQQMDFPFVIFNPVILKGEGKTTYQEGCLSIPTYFETVERYDYVEVQGLDKQGQSILVKVDGLASICLQHEMDHLDGKLFIDRLSLVKANRIKTKIKKFGYPTKEEIKDERDARL